jgi:hypothetical protein
MGKSFSQQKKNNKKKPTTMMKDFLKNNYKTIFQISFVIFVIYWILFFLTPTVKMAQESKIQLELLNQSIKNIENEQKKLDSTITIFNQSIKEVENSIGKIKQQKTIVKEYWHEKIISVDTFGRRDVDSFFSKRYP